MGPRAHSERERLGRTRTNGYLAIRSGRLHRKEAEPHGLCQAHTQHHFDAPAEKVFHYVEDPAHFVAAMPEEDHSTVGAVNRTPEGAVSTYEIKYRELGMHLTGVFTREEYVANERIVDHSSLGVVITFSVVADDSGTTLTASWDASTLMKMLDTAFFHSDKDVERALATYKSEIEALATVRREDGAVAKRLIGHDGLFASHHPIRRSKTRRRAEFACSGKD